MVCPPAENFGGLTLTSLAFGRKILVSLEADQGLRPFSPHSHFSSLPLAGRQLDMAEILLTEPLNINSNNKQNSQRTLAL